MCVDVPPRPPPPRVATRLVERGIKRVLKTIKMKDNYLPLEMHERTHENINLIFILDLGVWNIPLGTFDWRCGVEWYLLLVD